MLYQFIIVFMMSVKLQIFNEKTIMINPFNIINKLSRRLLTYILLGNILVCLVNSQKTLILIENEIFFFKW